MSKSEYQKFILTELVALIQKKYKIEIIPFFFNNKNEIIIHKPLDYLLQVYTSEQAEIYKVVFVMNIFYFKIIRKLY
jgi:hypothetical protein